MSTDNPIPTVCPSCGGKFDHVVDTSLEDGHTLSEYGCTSCDAGYSYEFERCQVCQGEGWQANGDTCPTCHGECVVIVPGSYSFDSSDPSEELHHAPTPSA